MNNATKLKRQLKYEKKRREQGTMPYKCYVVKCHILHDSDIIQLIQNIGNKSGYLKQLIRQDIEYRKERGN